MASYYLIIKWISKLAENSRVVILIHDRNSCANSMTPEQIFNVKPIFQQFFAQKLPAQIILNLNIIKKTKLYNNFHV